MLDDENCVARVTESHEQAQQTGHVARVQSDGGLVEDIQRIHEAGAERVRQADALRLTTGERARRSIERQIIQPDIAEELHAIARFLEQVVGDASLEIRQIERVEPREELIDRQLGYSRDGVASDPHLQRVGLQLRAPTGRTHARGLIPPQEHADVLLVSFLLQVLEEGENPLVAANSRAQQPVARAGRQALPRHIHRDLLAFRELRQRPALVLVPWHRPRIDRSVAKRTPGVRYDESFVVLEDGAEAVAFGAGAARAVEREELRRGRGSPRAVVRALEPFGESPDLLREERGRRREELLEGDDAIPVALSERGRDGIGQPTARAVIGGEAVDDHAELLCAGQIDCAAFEIFEVEHATIGLHAHEPLGAKVLDDDFMRHGLGQAQRKGDRKPAATRKTKDRVGDRLHRVGAQLAAANPAVRASNARPQQAQIVVNLRGGAHGGSRGLGRILLLDRDRRGQALDDIDVGLLHALEELARIRRQRLDVPALSFGVNGVKRERRLARAGRSCDDGEGAARNLEVDAFQIVLASASDANEILHSRESTKCRASGAEKCRCCAPEKGRACGAEKGRSFAADLSLTHSDLRLIRR
ncbi:MAG: hypothetical protein WD825_06740, partial [Gemmatimonadaceae bacterium]